MAYRGLGDMEAARTHLAQRGTVGIRPEHFEYSHEAGDWEGKIVVEEQLGSDAILYVEVPTVGLITVRAVGERNYHGGENIFLTLHRQRCHVFGDDDVRLNRDRNASDQNLN